MEEFKPLEDLVAECRVDEEVAELVNQLVAWHGGQLETLKEMANSTTICLQDPETGEEDVIDDPQVIKGYRVGLYVAEQLLGKLPITINE